LTSMLHTVVSLNPDYTSMVSYYNT